MHFITLFLSRTSVFKFLIYSQHWLKKHGKDTQKDMKKGEREKKHKNGDPRQCNCAKKNRCNKINVKSWDKLVTSIGFDYNKQMVNLSARWKAVIHHLIRWYEFIIDLIFVSWVWMLIGISDYTLIILESMP